MAGKKIKKKSILDVVLCYQMKESLEHKSKKMKKIEGNHLQKSIKQDG